MYNHSGRPILSIAHAVMLLGWLQVRNLVSAVRFIEHFAAQFGMARLSLFFDHPALGLRSNSDAVASRS